MKTDDNKYISMLDAMNKYPKKFILAIKSKPIKRGKINKIGTKENLTLRNSKKEMQVTNPRKYIKNSSDKKKINIPTMEANTIALKNLSFSIFIVGS